MESINIKIGDIYINSKMTKTNIDDFLITHAEVYSEYLPEKLGYTYLYLKYQDGVYKTDITIEFVDENITSIEKNTHEFYIFPLEGVKNNV